MAASDWQYTEADYTPEQWATACLVDCGGAEGTKARYRLPVRDPRGALTIAGLRAAAQQFDCVPTDKKAAAARKLVALYDELGEEPPTSLVLAERAEAVGPVEHRAATLGSVDVAERIVTVLAVPYEEPAMVDYRGQMWHEVFSRSAFNGIGQRQRRIPVNRDHQADQLVGKVVGAFPDRDEGLVLDLKVSKTPRGDETLELAADDVLSPSVGFAVRGSDQVLDKRSMTRRVNRAFLDHLALVPQQAYAGAHVMSMRGAAGVKAVASDTPNLDAYLSDPIIAWAHQRVTQAAQ